MFPNDIKDWYKSHGIDPSQVFRKDPVNLGVSHTIDMQSGKLTPIVPATLVTAPSRPHFIFYEYYFEVYGRESSCNLQQMKDILIKYEDDIAIEFLLDFVAVEMAFLYGQDENV